jgi:hypothetical protein
VHDVRTIGRPRVCACTWHVTTSVRTTLEYDVLQYVRTRPTHNVDAIFNKNALRVSTTLPTRVVCSAPDLQTDTFAPHHENK